MEVCQPSLKNGRGKPYSSVSGPSIGKAYHHLVIPANEIRVNGSINLIIKLFISTLYPHGVLTEA